jgi:hypothetical protein
MKYLISLITVWFLSFAAFAQTAHRTYYSEIDSLERLLAANPPAGT